MKNRTVSNQSEVIAAEEWDFERLIHRLGLNESQVYFCMTYEYAREVPGIVRAFRKDRAYHGRNNREQAWHFVMSSYANWKPDEPYNDHVLEVIDAPVGFPERPYLSVHTKHRISAETHWPFDLGEPVRNVRKDFISSPHYDYHLHIGWGATDRALIRSFGKWLKANRKIASTATRGKSKLRRYLRALKALGGYRLLNHFGSVHEARAFTVAQGHPSGLYANQPEWSEAKAHVLATLAVWRQFDPNWAG